MRIALDLHGVIDAIDLSKVAKILYDDGHEVFILTGMHWSDEAEEYLKKHGFTQGINYKKFLSVSDYHKKLGTPMYYDERKRPWLDPEIWNSTKAQICHDYNIDVLVDDSAVYAKYFDDEHCTSYLLFNKETVLEDIDKIVKSYTSNSPYIVIEKTVYIHKWNPNYDQDAICECGHTYYRHFDPYEQMDAVGCKYCQCNTFKPKDKND
jgi:hypothetical protein